MPMPFPDPLQGSACRPAGRSPAFALAIFLVGALLVSAGPAQAQQAPEAGLYQTYVFGKPDSPSEAWLLAYGGRLYDLWWSLLDIEPPERTHRAYPATGRMSGAATWRCVTCHGWDYRGRDGLYRDGPHHTGIVGIRAMADAGPAQIAAVIRDETHGYSPDLIPDEALQALALFVSKGQHDTGPLIDDRTGRVHGDVERGAAIYQNICAICHDFDGQAWITGEEPHLQTLAAVAAENPWQALHKVRNGQPMADMPAMRVFDLQTAIDILAYAQTLEQE